MFDSGDTLCSRDVWQRISIDEVLSTFMYSTCPLVPVPLWELSTSMGHFEKHRPISWSVPILPSTLPSPPFLLHSLSLFAPPTQYTHIPATCTWQHSISVERIPQCKERKLDCNATQWVFFPVCALMLCDALRSCHSQFFRHFFPPTLISRLFHALSHVHKHTRYDGHWADQIII